MLSFKVSYNAGGSVNNGATREPNENQTEIGFMNENKVWLFCFCQTHTQCCSIAQSQRYTSPGVCEE